MLYTTPWPMGTLEQTLARTNALLRNDRDLLRAGCLADNTPLLLAAYTGRRELVEFVLGLGAELDLISAVVLGRRLSAVLGRGPERDA